MSETATHAEVTGIPRGRLLRLADRVDATDLSNHTWVPTTYVWDWRGRLHRDYTGPDDTATFTWDELVAKHQRITIRPWRRALTWLAFALYLVVATAVLLGFSAGGGYAVAAGITVIVAVIGGIFGFFYYMAIGRW